MEISLSIKSIDVKRLTNFIISICFVVFGIISGYIMIYFNTVVNNTMDIIIKVISTVFLVLFALAALFINFVTFKTKNENDIGYYLSSGLGIGMGIAVECCSLLKYPLSALFFWPFAVIPIIVFAINTTVWAIVCKNKLEIDTLNLINKKNKFYFICAFIISVGIGIALLIYFIISSNLQETLYSLIPISVIVPILVMSILCFTISAIKKRELPFLPLFVGLNAGLLWIFEFNKFLNPSILNINLSFLIYVLGSVGLIVWLAYKVIDCVLIIKSNKKSPISVDTTTNE